MKPTILFLCFLCFSCKTEKKSILYKKQNTQSQTIDKIKVLNFGTFHFGHTPDANKTEFDEHAKESQEQIREISKMLAKFKPTIICIESLPKYNDEINKAYQEFLNNYTQLNTKYAESSMIGFEVGRWSNVKKIHGIDNQMGYNYSVGDYIENTPELQNSIDPKTYLQLTNEPFKEYPEMVTRVSDYDKLSLLEKLKLINEPIYLDHSINTNADKLLYVGIEDGFEGADNAAIFYHRNMKIYSNLNRIPMTKNDRIFIIMGTAHTAFLREFIKRSPKFEMVNTLEYLN